ncbi:anti-sigma factor [Jiangella alba]|uniref:Regulator of SigK n=1 Tax=Jiangella alba TaxID=561176 RepID=A0A1H5PST9_9ACTN|nr:anti-sigma factor [Jiangella alba]SEF16241.1 Anti-sigma-K factor RskA [Jiangella alba]
MNEPVDAGIHTLAAPYALHALPPDEVSRFEEHLEQCADCRVEVDELRETAARLGVAAAVTPPPRMRDEVLARIAEVRPLPPRVASGSAGAGLESGAGAGSGPDSAAGSAAGRALRRWWPRVATGLAAAAVAAIVVLGIRLNDVQSDLDRSQQIGAQMRQLVGAEDMEMVRVGEGDTSGTVLLARSLDVAVFIGDGMAPAPAGHTYQLWFMHEDGGVVSAGVLGNPPDGHVGPFTARGLAGADRLGITVEPDGGSPQPTTDPVMMIDLPAA